MTREFDNYAYHTNGPELESMHPNYHVVSFDPPVNPDALASCCQSFAEQHPHLFLTVKEENNRWYLAEMPKPLWPDVVTLSSEAPETIMAQAISPAKHSLHSFIIDKSGRFLIHRLAHALADAYSSKILLCLVLDAYRAMQSGEAFEYPPLPLQLLEDHLKTAKQAPNGQTLRKGRLVVAELYRYFTRPKLQKLPFNQEHTKDFFLEEYEFPESLFEFTSQCQAQHPGITLNDATLAVLVQAYFNLTQAESLVINQTNNLRRPNEVFTFGNLSSVMRAEVARKPELSAESVQALSQARHEIQHGPRSYQLALVTYLKKLKVKSYKALHEDLKKNPVMHMLFSNAGSFPDKSYPHYERLAKAGFIADYKALGYQFGGIRTFCVLMKSPKGQRMIIISKSSPAVVKSFVAEVNRVVGTLATEGTASNP